MKISIVDMIKAIKLVLDVVFSLVLALVLLLLNSWLMEAALANNIVAIFLQLIVAYFIFKRLRKWKLNKFRIDN